MNNAITKIGSTLLLAVPVLIALIFFDILSEARHKDCPGCGGNKGAPSTNAGAGAPGATAAPIR